MSMLRAHLGTRGFYFSYTYDLTRAVGESVGRSTAQQDSPLFQRVHRRYYWNYHAQHPFHPRTEVHTHLPVRLV